MYISDFKLVDILKDKMGEHEARTLVEYVEERIEEKHSEAKITFSNKDDIHLLELKIIESIQKSTESIHISNLEIQKIIANVQKEIYETKAHTEKLFSETNLRIAELKADTQKQISEVFKWLIIFIFSSTISILGTIIAVMRMGGWGH